MGIKKVFRAVSLSALAVLIIAAPVMAASMAEKCGEKYPNLKIVLTGTTKGGAGSFDDYVRCETIVFDEAEYVIYGKERSNCTDAGAIKSNPDVCNDSGVEVVIQFIINGVIFAISVIAIVMIVLGAIAYAASKGDPAKVKRGRDTMLYGIIGLIVALLAFMIVNFALTALE